ncbi:MAG: PAS domain S-box protein, partial [Spirochaetota bacterium]|nr:PAS domain S-box protein [Spirochaetota bacterium]
EFLRIVGQKNINDVLNHYILDWTAPYDIKRTIEAFKEFQTKGAARNFDMDIVRSDGNIIPISINANVASVKGIDHIFVLSTDITERKKIEKELKDSEELLRRSQEFSNMISWDTDILNDSIRWSGDVESHYGYSAKELNNIKAFYKSIHPDDFAKVDESLMESINNGCDYRSEFRVVWPDGSVHWLLAWGNALRDADGRATNMIGMGRDITEYKQAELALRESEEKYRHLVEHANDGIALVQETILEYVNPRYAEILGYSVDEMIGTRYSDYISPHEKDRVINIYKSRLAGEDVPPRYETILVRKDGKEIIVEINASLITFGGKQSHFVIIRDMTERKRAEEERDRLKNQLHHSQRMEAIGTLAGGIAHDFNNLLMGIQGRTSLMMMDIDGSHPFFEHLMGIEDYIHSAADLTKQLLGFARGGKYYVKPTDLNDLIRKTSSMFARTRKEIRIHEKYNNELWTVDVDQGQIEQAVLNMYVNAWQAMPAGGDLYIETENVVLDKNYIKPYDVQPGEYVKTSITDTGVGMDKKVQQRIFEPFFTTKDMGRGTGLGLASVYGIIKNHGGIINVYSEKGHGSTFSFYLPVTDKEIVIESEYSKEVVKGEGIVLIVDDEDMILDVGERLLDSFGYIVLKANNGYDAIEIYKKEMNNIKLVILDMIMPGLSGGETYDKLREINPDIKVLLSSGYSINGEASDIINRGCNGFIQKPYNMKQLSQKIFEILNRK